jgi:hypothetical protein
MLPLSFPYASYDPYIHHGWRAYYESFPFDDAYVLSGPHAPYGYDRSYDIDAHWDERGSFD